MQGSFELYSTDKVVDQSTSTYKSIHSLQFDQSQQTFTFSSHIILPCFLTPRIYHQESAFASVISN